jgi:chromate transporter
MSSEIKTQPDHLTTASPTGKTGLWRMFVIFLVIGLQSFGGGSATFLLIQQASEKYGWMRDEEFIKSWAICQLSPGINLIKLTILIGNRLRGWRGILAATSGMMVPSALVTALMTAFYTLYKDLPAIQAAMRGILPATIGLSLAMSANLAVPVFKAAIIEGWKRLWLQIVLVVLAALAMAFGRLSPVLIMLAAASLTALMMTYVPVPPKPAEESKSK